MYVIHKFSRAPDEESYSGPTWDHARIRHKYKEQYETYEEATLLAIQLSEFNPIGFLVTKVK